MPRTRVPRRKRARPGVARYSGMHGAIQPGRCRHPGV